MLVTITIGKTTSNENSLKKEEEEEEKRHLILFSVQLRSFRNDALWTVRLRALRSGWEIKGPP